MIVQIEKVTRVRAHFNAPPSKSLTHRAFITASLGVGDSVIRRPLQAADTAITRDSLTRWGVPIEETKDGVLIKGCAGVLRCGGNSRIDVRDSGTSMRFLTSLALLCKTTVILEGSPRMHERPIGPLVQALNILGAHITYQGKEGYPPLRISGSFRGGEVVVSGRESSQFISSLLLASPYAEEDVTITCPEIPVSRSYIDSTLSVMDRFGASFEHREYTWYRVKAGMPYRGTDFTVEGDWSSSAYFLAIPAVCGGTVSVHGLDPDSTQGDRLFLDSLVAMGCSVRWENGSVSVSKESALTGIHIDMSSAPDIVPILCVVAACANTPSILTGVRHLRLKESDRIRAISDMLRVCGAGVETEDDSITIIPAPLHGGVIDPRNDHRIVMSAAILGLGTGGITVLHAECVNKSFPAFWSMLQEAGLG
ncbi:MAG: 3-phosphoshikimate 1-carboxyvinyltransferase [Methanomicrobiales archaeon]|nr:3-phosphoshikimate 1-carboxyvinyltransferase [Methanomicrobiales archaeon]